MNWLHTETISLWNLKLALVLCCMLVGCSRSHTEKVTLPGGEIVINESTPAEWKSAANNKIFFQRNASSPREEVGDAWAQEDNTIISLSNPAPKLFTDGDNVTLALNSYVFQRIPEKQAVHWSHKSTETDEIASLFIRSLLPTNSPLLNYIGSSQKPTRINPFFVPYVFDQFDPKENILTTRCAYTDPAVPKLLIYSAIKYGSPWTFDLERTRKANNLNPPPDSDILIDFSVIAYPGGIEGLLYHSNALEIPGAKEIYAQTVPLSYTAPLHHEYTLNISPINVRQEHYDIQLAFRDPIADYVTLSWQKKGSRMPHWDCVRIDTWVPLEPDSDTSSPVGFFRLRQAPP